METMLYVTTASGEYVPASADVLIEAARAVLARRFRRGSPLASPRAAREWLSVNLSLREHEVFVVLLLDNRHRLISCVELFRGTIDGARAHPREVVKEAFKHNA